MRTDRMPECCLLPPRYNACTRKLCTHCGWNKDERTWRKMLRKKMGLILGNDGVYALRLPIKIKNEEEEQ